MAFRTKRKEAPFIEVPKFNPHKPFLTDIYKLIFLPNITTENMAALGIVGSGRALYQYVQLLLKNEISQLYQIPAVRQYFGAEFIHGLTVEYDKSGNYIKFINIDDTEVAEQFLRELIRALEYMIHDFLEEKCLAIYFQGETFTIIPETELPKQANRYYRQIAWQG